MRKLLLFIITLLPGLSFAQYSNDWIPFSPLQNYSLQEYYRIPVANDGVYRIDSFALIAGLVSVANNPTFDHRRFQIFYKGVEQYIYIYDENQNNVLDANDYIEFYGKPNDGSLDVPLYNDPLSQANPNYSLINDTASYYLTWVTNISPPFNTKRLQVVNDTGFQNYTPAAYFLKNVRKDYYSAYYGGSTLNNEDFDMEITATEGWFDSEFNPATPANKTINTPNVYTPGPDAQFETVFVGASNSSYQFDHKVKISFNGTEIAMVDFDGYEIRKENKIISPGSLLTANTVNYTALNPTSTVDRNALSYISITYPHSMSFAGESELIHKMTIPFNTSESKTYLEMTGLTGSSYYIYDFTDNLRIPLVEDSGIYMALIQNATTGADKEIGLFNNASVVNLNNIKAVNSPTNPRFRNFNAAGLNYDYIIITHSKLQASANQYKIHRENSGHNVIVVDIDELYGQFIYGVYKHPLAIRNFIRFVTDKWAAPNKHMFLLGKALHAKTTRHNATSYSESLVPSMGNPPSDNLLSTRILPGTYYTPAIATGRLAANNNQQVTTYLNKVISYENQPDAKWMKKVLHFGGGSSAAEQQELKNYLTEYANIISNPFFGAHVDSVYKTSSEPIQINQSEYIREQIDSGVTLMTFFGHSSANSFDVATDHPSTFNNKDRYHFVLANGCYAGDIHQSNANNETVASEDFVLIADKGAIGFLAHAFTEFASSFYPYSKEIYNQVSKTNYGGSIGHSIKNTIDSIELPLAPQYLKRKTVCLGMTLHGDPAIVLNSFSLPDYTVSTQDISFSPENITTELTEFTLNIRINNIGKATQDTFLIEIKRIFSDESKDIITDTVFNVYYSQLYSKILPVDPVRGPGLNIFEVRVDAADHVDELSESNNYAPSQLIIQSNDVSPVYPYEFDIVPTNTLQLKATTANPFDLTPRNYIFEIDTTDAFNSTVKQQQVVTSGGGVVSTPQLNLNYEQVYYWRVTLDDNGTYKWRESSFICKPNTTGWSQAHFFQYKKNNYYGVSYNKPDRKFDFVTVTSSLVVINSNNPDFKDPEYNINNVVEDYAACQITPSMHIVVLDSLTHRPWETRYPYGSTVLNPNNNFGNANDMGCAGSQRTRPDKYFIFRANDPSQLQAMANMITNNVPNGNYIIAYSVFDGLFTSWPKQAIDALESLGADSVRYLADDQPYIFFVQKGYPNTAEEVFGESTTTDTIIYLYKTLIGNWDRGYVESTKIGPAKSWTSLHWEQHSLENPSQDIVHLDVIGINNQGNETVLISGIQPSTPVLNLSTTIQASQYPYLKLKAVMKDSIFRTPPQLDYWQIYYEGVPELALNPSKYFEFYKDTVHHGENIKLAMAVENISSYNADSVLVDFYLYNRNKVRVPINTIRHKPLFPGDTLITKVEFSSIDFPELNSLWIEANPNNDQLEQYHFNNLGEIKFYAMRDVTNPILDVTFDGVHILNGDIVSSKPHIVITLKDENKFLAIEDTSNFAVFLTYPDGRLEKLHFEKSSAASTDNTLLKWYPASLPKNQFRIEYLPVLAMDGKYELKIQGKDVSDNLSGTNEYRISFEVINRSTITHILNYPNPFSTSTRFVFTLTGSEIPTQFKIQIMTVTGKIVREIMDYELGPIRIGRNITEYAWNGTDEFGDKLANGLYLYRVITQIHGANIERRETEADAFFTKNFGKMYILR
jgi:hypothetical protein